MTESAPPYPGGPQAPQGPPPTNNLVWAILTLICCWPFAIPAIVKAAKVNGLWAQGQFAEAQAAAQAAKKWAIIAAIIGVVWYALWATLFAVGVITYGTVGTTPS